MAEAVFPVESASATAARRFVVDELERWGAADVADEAAVLVSELVSNAVHHARTPATVQVQYGDSVVRVEVKDDSAEMPYRPEHSLEAVDGRGLRIVQAIADHWGVQAVGAGKCVWFELDRRTRTDEDPSRGPLPGEGGGILPIWRPGM